MSDFEHEWWTLHLTKFHARRPCLCVHIERSPQGNYRARLADLQDFRGHGSTQGLAIDDLADELEFVAAEIRRESGLKGLVAGRTPR